MPDQTSMIHVRVDDAVRQRATEALAVSGLTLSDAVRILLARVVAEGGLPPGLAADPAPHAAWFQGKVGEALADPRPSVPHDRVIRGARALIEAKRQAQP